MILDAVPESLKAAIAGGIGIFIAFIGLTEAGIVVKHPAPQAFVQLGDLGSPVVLVSLAGLLLCSVLVARRVRGGILIAMATTRLHRRRPREAHRRPGHRPA
jgi:AGZA family xanthine/uracil permease-like MFS transporter